MSTDEVFKGIEIQLIHEHSFGTETGKGTHPSESPTYIRIPASHKENLCKLFKADGMDTLLWDCTLLYRNGRILLVYEFRKQNTGGNYFKEVK